MAKIYSVNAFSATEKGRKEAKSERIDNRKSAGLRRPFINLNVEKHREILLSVEKIYVARRKIKKKKTK